MKEDWQQPTLKDKLIILASAILLASPLVSYIWQILLWATGLASPAGFLKYGTAAMVTAVVVSAIVLPAAVAFWHGGRKHLVAISLGTAYGLLCAIGSIVSLTGSVEGYTIIDVIRDALNWGSISIIALVLTVTLIVQMNGFLGRR
jgi:hypothetical protein